MPRTGIFLLCLVACGLESFRVDATEPAADPNQAELPRVAWDQADSVVGRTARVVGTIQHVGRSGRVNFLDFHADRREGFTIVIFRDALGRFRQDNSRDPTGEVDLKARYLGKIVEVQGEVTRYANRPQIVVQGPDQIRILDRMPAQPPRHVTPVRDDTRPADAMRIATFNVKNLFDGVDDPYTRDEGTPAKPRRELEALARMMRRIDADVLALQEVESRGYLQQFVDDFLPGIGYEHVIQVEGNDLRGIDVAVLSRFPVGPVTTHQYRRFPGADGRPQSFVRDLLQVVVEPPDEMSLEVWVVHFKSNSEGRERAVPVRQAEAAAVRAIYDQRLRSDSQARIVLCGDFNDSADSQSLSPLLSGADAPRQLFHGLPASERVTYHRPPFRSMIDFLFVTPAMERLSVHNSYRVHVADADDLGSDHHPVSVDFRLRAR